MPHRFEPSSLSAREATRQVLADFTPLYLLAVPALLLVHFPARVFAHLSLSRSGFAEMWPHPVLGQVAANLCLLASLCFVEAYLIVRSSREPGAPTSAWAAARIAVRRVPVLALTRLIYLTAVVGGLVLGLVPGIVLALRWFPHAWYVVAERSSPWEALRASWKATSGRLRPLAAVSAGIGAVFVLWLGLGYVLVGLTLRMAAPVMPIFKVAPFAMTVAESGMVWLVLLAGVLFRLLRVPVSSGDRVFEEAS